MGPRTWPVLCLAVLLVLTGFGGEMAGLRPGGRIGTMVLRRGTAATADFKLFDLCNPIVAGSGPQTRRCGPVAHVKRLFIGYGSFAPPNQINQLWKQTTWSAWLDHHQIQLAAFGSSDRFLYAFPPAGGKDVTLREWRLMLVKPAAGRHTIRYRSVGPDGNSDVTWIFTVASS